MIPEDGLVCGGFRQDEEGPAFSGTPWDPVSLKKTGKLLREQQLFLLDPEPTDCVEEPGVLQSSQIHKT